ncbi:MAG TPA: FkbM family methyltransferase [Flavisolibacter sp.]|nr:FkbM family methyltransferase [Flavisolibacter sp.]
MKRVLKQLRTNYHLLRVLSKIAKPTELLSEFLKKGQTITVPLKAGGELTLRNNNLDDVLVAEYVFIKQFHIPPFSLPANATILDLGSNIGCTVIDYANKYPGAKIIGVELDQGNYSLCKKNAAQFKNAHILNKAVWYEKNVVKYDPTQNKDAFSAVDKSSKDASSTFIEVEAITIREIMEQNGLDKVDFIKMDIEGAEFDIFQAGDTSWLDSVNAIHIEIHKKEWFHSIINTLNTKNFVVTPDENHWSAIFARKNDK